jgi:hypothetical protein
MHIQGYEITPYTLRPFDDNELSFGAEKRHRIKYNKYHSSARIIVEHTFGLLKGRFPSLKLLPGRDIPRMYKVIRALMVLHNIFLMIGDNAREIPGFDEDDADANTIRAELEADADIDGRPDPLQLFGQQVLQAHETADSLRRHGRRLRRDILNTIV